MLGLPGYRVAHYLAHGRCVRLALSCGVCMYVCVCAYHYICMDHSQEVSRTALKQTDKGEWPISVLRFWIVEGLTEASSELLQGWTYHAFRGFPETV